MVITPEAAHSNWQAAELGAALALQKPLIPILAEDVPSKDIPLQTEAPLLPKSVSAPVRELIDERLDLPTG
jgi:hypothetical protein